MGENAIAPMQRFVVNIKAFFRYIGLAWAVCGKPSSPRRKFGRYKI